MLKGGISKGFQSLEWAGHTANDKNYSKARAAWRRFNGSLGTHLCRRVIGRQIHSPNLRREHYWNTQAFINLAAPLILHYKPPIIFHVHRLPQCVLIYYFHTIMHEKPFPCGGDE